MYEKIKNKMTTKNHLSVQWFDGTHLVENIASEYPFDIDHIMFHLYVRHIGCKCRSNLSNNTPVDTYTSSVHWPLLFPSSSV